MPQREGEEAKFFVAELCSGLLTTSGISNESEGGRGVSDPSGDGFNVPFAS
jgi:hypothetical protein